MKIKQGFVLREAAGSYVVMDLGNELSFNGMITLNETGAFIWRAVDEGKDIEEIAQLIAERYETDVETAKRDVTIFVSKMKDAGILE